VRLQGKHTKDSHCALCGDRLRESRFRVLEAQVQAGAEKNELITAFFGSVAPDTLALLNVPVLHAMNQRKKFTRELTEGLAMLGELDRIARLAGPDQPFHVIDLCCGKGFLATLVAVLYPAFTVTAVDWIEAPFLPHFAEANVTNCHYARLDVLAPSFPEDVTALIAEQGDKPAIVLGMHLCGLLSLAAVNLLREVPGVQALVLAPCCLPNQLPHRRGDTPASVYEATGQANKYERWCDHLECRMSEAAEGRRGEATTGTDGEWACTRRVESGIVSEKRTLLACG